MGYLDNTGLAYFWNKIKAYVDAHSGGGGGGSTEVDVNDLLHFEIVGPATASVASGSIVDVYAEVPEVEGYTRRGVLQTWTNGGTGTALLGAPWITVGNYVHVKMRGNTQVTNTDVYWYVMYTKNSPSHTASVTQDPNTGMLEIS